MASDHSIDSEIFDLGFDKPRAETRVVVAMSGGIDSSLCAAMLHKVGYQVLGITLQLFDYGTTQSSGKTCCAGSDIHDARSIAAQFDFPHYVLDYESRFSQDVIDNFVSEYTQGRTPIPCIQCNQTVKFRDLVQRAHDLEADCLVTGHYVTRESDNGGNGSDNGDKAHMIRANDHTKDQSYFLFATTQEQLEFLRFPLGKLKKSATREYARQLGLAIADKPDSQDICFVPNGDYAKIVRAHSPDAFKPGNIINTDGEQLGTHDGIVNFTIGQRKGLGIGGRSSDSSRSSDSDPLYVIALDANTNTVIAGDRTDLAQQRITIGKINNLDLDRYISAENDQSPIKIFAKYRSTMALAPCKLTKAIESDQLIVEFDDPQYGISPGQACVLYAQDRMIGGGWIEGKKQSPFAGFQKRDQATQKPSTPA